jgi:hypothetical protein
MQKSPTPIGANSKNRLDGFLKSSEPNRYSVTMVPVAEITPSPENVDVYGEINHDTDSELLPLMESIRRMGLEEPIVVTVDGFILSGHRRYVCCVTLGWEAVPVRYSTITRSESPDYHRLLVQYNPQRLKTVKTLLAEKFISGPEFITEEQFREVTFKKSETTATYISVDGEKTATVISTKRGEFLAAVVRVVNELRDFWPLSVRTIHYRLLNNPPLTQTTRSRDERWRYKNEPSFYNLLSEICVSARYGGQIPLEAIDDPTRVCEGYGFRTYRNPAEFIQSERAVFLTGYGRNVLEGQPRHVELLMEKNTLLGICKPVADRFMMPRSISRGYGNPSIWNKMSQRFAASGAEEFVLLTVSDHDPEGFDLVDDAIRSLRDLHGVPVKSVRVGLNMDQVRTHSAHPAFAKESSSRFTQYLERTGSNKCWEIEAVDPYFLQRELHDAILSVLDVEQLCAVQDLQRVEQSGISDLRRQMDSGILGILNGEGDTPKITNPPQR